MVTLLSEGINLISGVDDIVFLESNQTENFQVLMLMSEG